MEAMDIIEASLRLAEDATGHRRRPRVHVRIGVDSGGTFTDVVAYDPARGRLVFHKVASTPDDPAAGIVSGALEAAERAEMQAADVAMLIHGTTVATNQVLQRAGARVALITTAGFRDVLHIQRQSRPRMYDLRARRAEPLVPRELRFEVRERMRFDGTGADPARPRGPCRGDRRHR